MTLIYWPIYSVSIAERHNTSFRVIDGKSDTCVHFDVFSSWFGGEPNSELNQPWIRIQLGEFLLIHKVSLLLGTLWEILSNQFSVFHKEYQWCRLLNFYTYVAYVALYSFFNDSIEYL